MGQWEDLPGNLLKAIEKLITIGADKVRFRSICKTWQSAVPTIPNLRLPWLLLPCTSEANDPWSSPSCGLVLNNVLENKSYHLEMPKAERMLLRGSSHGWVVSVEGPHDEIYLINPLTWAKLQLPSRSKFPDVKEHCPDNRGNEYSIWNYNYDGFDKFDSGHVRIRLTNKFFLSSNPSLTDDYVVVALYDSYGLAYCRYGDEKWTSIPSEGSSFQDITFYKGKIHALNHNGIVELIDINPDDHPQTTTAVDISPPCPMTAADGVFTYPYLIQYSGGLLFVERHVKYSETTDPKRKFLYKTLHFRIFKLDLTSSNSCWCSVTDIGDDALFVGFNTSMSKSSIEFPELKRNSIYFTDDLYDFHYQGIQGGSEIGVFDLNNTSMESLPGFKCDSEFVWPPPIWVTPVPK